MLNFMSNNQSWKMAISSRLLLIIAFSLALTPVIAQHTDGESQFEEVRPTPALRLNDQDVTTVLLVNQNNRASHGRFLNVKPAVGLLTSTARTFIQEGVTTEYATQVLGTTLDNGRLYAQLLTKSSRVLYDNDNTLATKSLLLKHNDLVADRNWQFDDDRFLADNPISFVKNTDYISPNNPPTFLVFSTKSVDNPSHIDSAAADTQQQQQQHVQTGGGYNGVPSYQVTSDGTLRQTNHAQRVFYDTVYGQQEGNPNNGAGGASGGDSVSFSSSSSSSTQNEGAANNNNSVSVSSSSSSSSNQLLAPNKVSPHNDLSTFTIRNEFAPSGFSSWSDNDFEEITEKATLQKTTPTRSGKQLFRAGGAAGGGATVPEKHSMTSVTYFGFADFTTIVGDTVIVFSPSTSAPVNAGGQVTSIKGEATIHELAATATTLLKPTVVLSPSAATAAVVPDSTVVMSIDTLLMQQQHNEAAIDVVTEKVIEEATTTTTTTTTTTEASDVEGVTEQEQENIEAKSAVLAKEQMTDKYDISKMVLDASTIQSSHDVTLTPDAIQPSETQMHGTLSTPSNEDIAKIFASLASANLAASQSVEKPIETSSTPTQELTTVNLEPETQILGGVTTIFFEDDPFLEATSSIPATTQSTIAVATEGSSAFDTTTEEMSLTTHMDETTVSHNEDNETTESSIETTTNMDMDDEQHIETTSEKMADNENKIIACTNGVQIEPSTTFKTLTYLTTFFIPVNDSYTTTSIKSNAVVSTEVSQVSKSCDAIQGTVAVETPVDVIEKPMLANKKLESVETTTMRIDDDEDEAAHSTTEDAAELEMTTLLEVVTEKKHVTEASKPTNNAGGEEMDEDDPNNGQGEGTTIVPNSAEEEFELIYKTLYTTYTYLTTFFHESTSSISSRKEVVTNIVTSTLDQGLFSTDKAVAGLISDMVMSVSPTSSIVDELPQTSVGVGRPTTTYAIPKSDLVRIDDILDGDITSVHATPILDSAADNIKTYYTTYTYFTTIFVDGETEISSRTEVYTNYVGNSISATAVQSMDGGIEPTKTVTENIASVLLKELESDTVDTLDNNVIQPTSTYSTMVRGLESTKVVDEDATTASSSSSSASDSSSVDEQVVRMVTDVKSSSSDGDRHIIENNNKQWNGLLEDQISSESNTEDILPSPTLLLQTSFTTFTYFTTMYLGSSSSNILSRLETITNVVTETVQPSQTISIEDASLPITYFTTFTYWTTLFKEGSVVTTSREETISNIVTPTISATAVVGSIEATTVPAVTLDNIVEQGRSIDAAAETTTITTVQPETLATASEKTNNDTELSPSEISPDKPTTYYTTYTYYTTSYVGDETVLNSRFETVTNVAAPVETTKQAGRALNINAAGANAIDSNEKSVGVGGKNADKPIQATPQLDLIASTATGSSSSSSTSNLQSTGVVSLNQGKIIDAEGISTIFYTTKAVGSYIDNLYAQVIESTSSVLVDEAKKSALPVETESTRTHKTGLVRLIEGTNIFNRTTTLYQSKVIGTIIDGRYAQIIESTSSFLIEKTIEPSSIAGASIAPTKTDLVQPTSTVISPTPAVIESSIQESTPAEGGDDEGGEHDGEEEDEGEEGEDGDGRVKSRLTFSTRKRTFTPVIRPFASRNRPTFNPKRKNVGPSSAATITRSDFTPTITATPALKSESTRGRFSSNRKSSAANPSSASTNVAFGGSRRFSRPRASSSGAISPTASVVGSSRIRGGGSSSGRIQPTRSGGFGASSRSGGIFRGGSSSARTVGSAFPSTARFRVKPTQSAQVLNTNTVTTPRGEEDDTTDVDEISVDGENGGDDESVTTENSRRNQNPLLRFRRPFNGGGRSPSIQTTTNRPATISTRRSPLSQRNRLTTTSTTTTTPKPKSRSFARPSLSPIANIPNRPRPVSNLFPPRNLFRPSSADQDQNLENDNEGGDEEENEEESNDDLNAGFSTNLNNDEEATETQTDAPRQKRNAFLDALNIMHKRSKRQVDYGTRSPNYTLRYRRPTSAGRSTTTEESAEVEDTPAHTPRPRASSRFNPRSRSNSSPSPKPNNHNSKQTTNSRIRPTSPSSNHGRSQFTLREKDNQPTARSQNYRRLPTSPKVSGNRNRKTSTTISSRPKAPRLRNFQNAVTEPSYTSRSGSTRSRSNNRRTTTRSRGRNQENNDYVNEKTYFDGTITVTHQIPTDITIPVVNNGVTEYKNVVTAKVSTEVLGPKQYSTLTGVDGSSIVVLASEKTGIQQNGVTEITQFILHETPTTSITFTPTSIRGRKTSFSHIVPSTVYNVEQVVSTVQPEIGANAPLANILLSQLLLGNLGLPQQNINPLLGIQQPQQQIAATMSTEYKVRTTTYVTTVTDATSTVIPITFRGKEILTTIVESSVNVITATEFITDTVVVTPTPMLQQNQQFNSLLLPLLLQQQQAQQQAQQPQPQPQLAQQQNPLLAFQEKQQFEHAVLLQKDNLSVDSDENRFGGDDDQPIRESEEFPEQEPFHEVISNKKPKKKDRIYKAPAPPPIPLDTSVITLYVSGRRPGEFSTVLSTVVVGQDSQVRKRAAEYVRVGFSNLPDFDYLQVAESELNEVQATASNHITPDTNNQRRTDSLESFVGDVTKYISVHLMSENTNVPFEETSRSAEARTNPRNGNFENMAYELGMDINLLESFEHDDDDHDGIGQLEARRNNNNMDGESDAARYNLATRKMSNGVEVIVASDKSTMPGEPNILRILSSNYFKPMTLAPSTIKNHVMMMMPNNTKFQNGPGNDISALFSQSNQFVTKTCLTTYTYLTTFLQDGTTTVESRENVISNIATEEQNIQRLSPTVTPHISLSQTPNLAVGVFFTTYTYLNTVLDNDVPVVISSKHTVTNTVTAPEDYISALQPSEPATVAYETNTYISTIALTKTLTNVDSTTTINTSDVLTKVVITESLPARSSATASGGAIAASHKAKPINPIKSTPIVADDNDVDANPLFIFATKTYMTSYTYYTTLANSKSKTEIRSHIRTKENIVTESIATSNLPQHQITSLKSALLNEVSSSQIVTLATFLNGQSLEVTAASTIPSNWQTKKISPSKTHQTNVNAGSTMILFDNESDSVAGAISTSDKLVTADSLTSESMHDIQIAADQPAVAEPMDVQVANKTKTPHAKRPKPSKTEKTPETPIPNIIESLNFNRLTAFSPVINAMAGLIQKNFGIQKSGTPIVSAEDSDVAATSHHAADASGGDSVHNDEDNSDERAPIYIPVGGIAEEGISTAETQNIKHSNYNAFEPPTGNWMNEEDQRLKVQVAIGMPTHVSLLNGGIPISPGEVISANSDVIIGKPTGIGPRLPASMPQANLLTGMHPPPPPPPTQHTTAHTVDSHSDSSHFSSNYIGPPPPLTLPTHNANTFNAASGVGKQPSLNNAGGSNHYAPHDVNYVPLKYHGNEKRINQQNFQRHEAFYNQQPPPPHTTPTLLQHQQLQQPSQYNELGGQRLRLQQFHHSPPVPSNIPFNYNNDIHAGELHQQHQKKVGDILEIKRIPEVFSTDLPPVYIPRVVVGSSSHHAGEMSSLQTAALSHHHILPEVIDRSTDQPLLVNIQPSQMANVIIPHGSSSALIFGGATEPHKNGKYFDDPLPYSDVDVSNGISQLKVVGEDQYKNQNVEINNLESHFPHPSHSTVYIPESKPSLGGHAANNNYDVNVGNKPLKFVKSQPFPQQVPLRHEPDGMTSHLPISYKVHEQRFPMPQSQHYGHKDNGHTTNGHGSSGHITIGQHYNGHNSNGHNINGPHSHGPKPHGNFRPLNQQQPNAVPIFRPQPHGNEGANMVPPPKPAYINYNKPNTPNWNQFNKHEQGGGSSKVPLLTTPLYIPHNNYNNGPSSHPIETISEYHVSHTHPTYQGQAQNELQHHKLSHNNHGSTNNVEQSPSSVAPIQNAANADYINKYQLSEDSTPIEHYQVPSISDEQLDAHNDDDFENEEGEVIQESNNVLFVPDRLNTPINTTLSPSTIESVNNLQLILKQHDGTTYSEGQQNFPATAPSLPSLPTPKQPQQAIHNGINNNNRLIYQVNDLKSTLLPPPLHQPIYPLHNANDEDQLVPDENLTAPTQQPDYLNNNDVGKRPGFTSFNMQQQQQQHQYQEHHKTRYQHGQGGGVVNRNQNNIPVSMQIDANTDDNNSNTSQTENPFDPKYTKIPASTKRPDHRPYSSASSAANHYSKPSQQTLPMQANATTTSTTSSLFSLNIGEVTTTREPQIPQQKQQHKKKITESFNEPLEIFDYKESVNPHNRGSIVEKNTTHNHYHNSNHDFGVIDQKDLQLINGMVDANITSQISQPSAMDSMAMPSSIIRPPPIEKYKTAATMDAASRYQHNKHTIADSLMTMAPPKAPPTILPSRTRENIYATRQRIPVTQRNDTAALKVTRINKTKSSTMRPSQLASMPTEPSHQLTPPLVVPTAAGSNILVSMQPPPPTPTMTVPPFKSSTRIAPTKASKPAVVSATGSLADDIASLDAIKDSSEEEIQNHKPIEYSTIRKNQFEKKTNSAVKADTSRGDRNDPSKYMNSLNKRMRLPNEVLILGSEQVITESTPRQQSSTQELKPVSPMVTTEHSQATTISRRTSKPKEVATKLPSQVRSTASPTVDVDSGVTFNKDQSKPTNPIPRNTVILPTKYVTNTKTLTVTTTKTTVIRSQGIPSTLTLTLTKTHTSKIVDTVTETETLVHPTQITISSPSIQPTATVYSHYPDYHSGAHYPAIPTASVFGTANLPSAADAFDDIGPDTTHLDEFIISYKDEDLSEPDVKPQSKSKTSTNGTKDNESFFIVMTDKSKPGVIKINPSVISTGADDQPESSDTMSGADFDLATRDEDVESNKVDHVLLGGILIATPPRLDAAQGFGSSECVPECKASRNELCQRVDGVMRCVCRPGFARMFPDRPCKPTYTYTLQMTLLRNGRAALLFNKTLTNRTSDDYLNLEEIVHEGLDRMVMQSDLRDIYQGIHVSGFTNTSTGLGVITSFYLQLSEKSDESRIVDVFKKYLRNNDYSLGGTNLLSAKHLVEHLNASDFDECHNTKFHDCSENAICFNLRGTYTCSCKEGFVDTSENPIYPGRLCSTEQIGCQKCQYHGTCYTRNDDQVFCECFQWYAGMNCHVNLKVLLIWLATIGAILFALLFVCVFLTCMKRKRSGIPTRAMMPNIEIVPHVMTRRMGQMNMDKRAMIQETCSESSESSNTLPYVTKHSKAMHSSTGHLSSKAKSHQDFDTKSSVNDQQKDRSLSVMIPRAKYHPLSSTLQRSNAAESYDKQRASVCSAAEAKLTSYLEGPVTKKIHRKSTTSSLQKADINGVGHKVGTGELVSAGYEVSAKVGMKSSHSQQKLQQQQQQQHQMQLSHLHHHHHIEGSSKHGMSEKGFLSDDESKMEFININQLAAGSQFHPIDSWLNVVPQTNHTVSEARSYDETMIQPPTKSMRSMDEKQSSHEANTMAERELGSTFLLPHTHLYKPDKGSDVSGFDSL